MPYARAITLRNCGRFTVVASDFGSDYRTHTHVTSEALYAGLTRGVTWRPHLIDLKHDADTFTLAYDVPQMPIWFFPGVFTAEGSHRLPDADLHTTAFNVVHEFYPTTSRSYVFNGSGLEEKGRPSHVPTYGTVQAIKPDRRVATWAFSPRRELLEEFAAGQVFMLGKKRTMFQILDLSTLAEGQRELGICATPFLQIGVEDVVHFATYEVLAATLRYLLIRGEVREPTPYWRFSCDDRHMCVPEWYLRRSPVPNLVS